MERVELEAPGAGIKRLTGKSAGAFAARIHDQFVDIVELWGDALALQRFIAWQQAQSRKVNGKEFKSAARREPAPQAITPLDQFFSAQGQTISIRRGQTPCQRNMWKFSLSPIACYSLRVVTRR